VTERERALLILRRIEQESTYAAVALHDDVARHGESPFIHFLVLAVLRWRSRIDFVIETLALRRLAKLDGVVVEILRLGLAQMMFMEVAPYAAVSESVTLADQHAKRAKGLVNAVLRGATRTDVRALAPQGDTPAAIAIREGHPEWLITRWAEHYGVERAVKIAHANQEFSYPDLILHPSASRDFLARVKHEPSELVEGMVRLRESTAAVIAEIDEGLAYPLDEGSAVIASIVVAAGREILDLAAAPGGKSLVMTLRGARVVSHDISLSRVQLLRHSAPAFLGASSRIVVGDGRTPAFRRPFQTVLLDAPCSATGTIRKNPELKWRLKAEELAGFATLQRELLSAALTVTAETCIYSTCSLEPEENEEVIAAVLATNPVFTRDDIAKYVEPAVLPWVEHGVLRLTPESGADGFTAFVLRRS
jgi:16S rRNA (cytosine967-C5)-methyltransferase